MVQFALYASIQHTKASQHSYLQTIAKILILFLSSLSKASISPIYRTTRKYEILNLFTWDRSGDQDAEQDSQPPADVDGEHLPVGLVAENGLGHASAAEHQQHHRAQQLRTEFLRNFRMFLLPEDLLPTRTHRHRLPTHRHDHWYNISNIILVRHWRNFSVSSGLNLCFWLPL